MKISFKSKDGLLIMQKLYESYENLEISRNWSIDEVDKNGYVTQMTLDFELPDVNEEGLNILALIALEVLRLKQVQFLRKYKVDLDHLEREEMDETVPREIISAAVDAIESQYYTSLIMILLSEYISENRNIVDLGTFATFNLKGYKEDFENKIESMKKLLDSAENPFTVNVEGDVTVVDGDLTGNPFDILVGIKSMWESTNRTFDTVEDIYVTGNDDGSISIDDGLNEILKADIEDELGFSIELQDAEADFNIAFEDAMLVVLYLLVFCKTKVIYVKDTNNMNIKNDIIAYLELIGAYPHYSPHVIERK